MIVQTGVDSPGVHIEFMTNCVAGSLRLREQIGEAAWVERMYCWLAGQTPQELRHCTGRDLPVHERLSEVDAALASEVCEHIFAIMKGEFEGALVPMTEQATFIQDCVEQFELACVDDPINFERGARCVLSVNSLDDLGRCDQD